LNARVREREALVKAGKGIASTLEQDALADLEQPRGKRRRA
jgi:hypothetical protein